MGASGLTVEDLEDKVRYLMAELSAAWGRIHKLERRVDELNAALIATVPVYAAGQAPGVTPKEEP